jgi:hypothetical protein
MYRKLFTPNGRRELSLKIVPNHTVFPTSMHVVLWRIVPSSNRMLFYRMLLYIGRNLKLYPPGQSPCVQRLPFNLYLEHDGRINKTGVE